MHGYKRMRNTRVNLGKKVAKLGGYDRRRHVRAACDFRHGYCEELKAMDTHEHWEKTVEAADQEGRVS